MKILVLFTFQFPYGKGETFLENEFPFLCTGFDKVYIVTTWESQNDIRPLPPNVQVNMLTYRSSLFSNILSSLYIFSPVFWRELFNIIFIYKININLSVISLLFAGISKGVKTKRFITKNLLREELEGSNHVLFYSYWLSDFTTGLALIKKRYPTVKAIARAHRWDLYFEAHSPAYIPLRSFIISELDYCYLISEDGLHYLDNLTQNKFTSHLKVARLGTFNNDGKLSGFNTGKLVIASCSYIIPNKRVYLIIEALALIDEITIEWVHFGHGAQLEETKKLAKNKLTGPNIKYEFKEETSNVDILKYYTENNIDLFINVSSSEGIPVSMMEAMSRGIPVIGTNVGGVSEIVANNKNGFLLPSNCTAPEIAETIRKYIKLPNQAKSQFRAAAFHKWDTEYNAPKNYTAFKHELDRLIADN